MLFNINNLLSPALNSFLQVLLFSSSCNMIHVILQVLTLLSSTMLYYFFHSVSWFRITEKVQFQGKVTFPVPFPSLYRRKGREWKRNPMGTRGIENRPEKRKGGRANIRGTVFWSKIDFYLDIWETMCCVFRIYNEK